MVSVVMEISWLGEGKGWSAGAGRVVAGRAVPVGEGAHLGHGLDRDVDHQELGGVVGPDDRFQNVVAPDDLFLTIGKYGKDNFADRQVGGLLPIEKFRAEVLLPSEQFIAEAL